MSDHNLLHGMKIARRCVFDATPVAGEPRTRTCGACGLKVINTEGLSDDDREALLLCQGLSECEELFRRADGRFVLGDCYSERMGNDKTAIAFALVPLVNSVLFWHPATLSILFSPVAALTFIPFLLWAWSGAVVVRYTRGATLSGVVFAIFVLPSLWLPVVLPH